LLRKPDALWQFTRSPEHIDWHATARIPVPTDAQINGLENHLSGTPSKAVIGLVGHVLKRLGDGLMALFRYDAAPENDAERIAPLR
jgi:hypothetical protein